MHASTSYAALPCRSRGAHALALREAGPAEPAKPRLLDRGRAAARLRHYSRSTEAAYAEQRNPQDARKNGARL